MRKKVLLSAFAMSLILLTGRIWAQTDSVDDFLGLEKEIVPGLAGEQKFSLPDLHDNPSWNVEPQKVIVDLPEPIKDQSHSVIPWSSLDPIEWLSIEDWLAQRKTKDNIPDWKIRLREADHHELMGKVLKCSGECFVYRGINKASVQHLSQIREGDELITGKNSLAWVFMIDGSLVRVSPDSSITLQEINISSKEIFFYLRINHGHLFWHGRTTKSLPISDKPETDTLSLPLLVREANQQFYERAIFKYQKDEGHLAELLDVFDNAVKLQFSTLNELKEKNNPHLSRPTRLLLVAPNASVISINQSFDFAYLLGDKSYFKKREETQGELQLYLRGYLNTEAKTITEGAWYEVQTSGRNFSQVEDVPGVLQVLELLTKRIKTIELAREIWIDKFTVPVLISAKNPELVAREYGYRAWGDELKKRIDFLLEYTRRIETTNLRSLDNLLSNLEAKGETFRRVLSDDLYQASLNDYLFGLKSRYDKNRMRVRELNDLQFYIWILRNGKF